ncbi:spermatogenesis-associated protein 7 isoform X1 [Malaclemys terrapin pileata]|uniref:spermatogenesis-associated protein 7 isoform X1 n=2 Tax=Malaclemys terrapin pileata TaxID=2991368 RepID=UPI0023A90AD4|nr:spermatogenesis-associated protein 7 isoform X1 [Malaclemys terrapin pileata]
MGVRMESGSRRSPVSEYPAIPRYGPASPFKGHLSTQSNAFCIDSSRRLNNQYLIRDHMAVHYNKILSAKAAVDCSVPKSRLTSIKFADQQRREKLKKEIARCEKEMSSAKNASRSSSRGSRRPLLSTFVKSSFEAEANDQLSPQAQNAQKYLSRSLLSSERQGLDLPNPAKCVRKDTRKTSNASISNSSVSVSSPQRKYSGVSYSSSAESVMNISPSHKHQDTESKVYSGDLLDRHSDHFTDSHQPFTPRTLKSDAKSFLSQYRYYTPAKRKRKDPPKQQVEAETQTDLSSFQSEDREPERKDTTILQKIITQAEVTSAPDESEGRMDPFQYSLPSVTSMYSMESPAMRKIQAEEEELRYLSFIEDVTDEILKLGLFSNRVLERLFERHIEQNKHRLDENKMRHLLDVLKVDLGCSTEKSERVNGSMEVIDPFDLERFETLDQLQFTSKNWKQSKTTKSEEFLKAMALLSKETDKLKHPIHSETSKQIHDKDIFSKDRTEVASVGTDPYSSVQSEEAPDISHTFEPTLNSTTCDSDFESNKELDDLEENFAEALQISSM